MYYITFYLESWNLQRTQVEHRFVYLVLISYAILSLKVGIMREGGETVEDLKR